MSERARLSFNMGVADAEKRFARAVRRGEPSAHRPDLGPCLIYLGADNGNGYGQFSYNGKNNYAHRYAWERVNGPIPDGLTVDHLCRVRICVEVSHMELVDAVTNFKRGAAARTKCRNGHAYTPENTRYRRGSRFCVTCVRVGQRRSYDKTKRSPIDRRVKYDPAARAQLVQRALVGQLSIREAAGELGCSTKYMDKIVRRDRRRRSTSCPLGCAVWTSDTCDCNALEAM